MKENQLESKSFGTVVSRTGSQCDQGSCRASAGEDAPLSGNKVLAYLTHTLSPLLEALGCIPALGKGSRSSLEEDMPMASVPEGRQRQCRWQEPRLQWNHRTCM